MAGLDANFRAGGLASGLDTHSIIDGLLKIEQRPLDMLRRQQSAMRAQISALGELTGKLGELETAAKSLASGGTVANKVTSSNSSFAATTGAGAVASTYDVTVDRLAVAAKQRTVAFGAGETVPEGTLIFTVMGHAYDPIQIEEGWTLADVAQAIREAGIPVTPTVVSNGADGYLTLTNPKTGKPLDGSDALSVVESYTGGSPGKALGFSEVQGAQNAKVTIDGIEFIRQSNVVTDAISGVTLTLKAQGAAEVLTVDSDVEGTAKNLRTFVDAYNAIAKVLKKHLDVDPEADRSVLLTGDSSVKALQQALQALMTRAVGNGNVRSLAEVGVKTGRDGLLTLDEKALSDAVARNPDGVNRLFSDATSGIAKAVEAVVDGATDIIDGTLTGRKKILDDNVRRLDGQAEVIQRRLDRFRESLVAQFTAMEKIVSTLRATGDFLISQLNGMSGAKK